MKNWLLILLLILVAAAGYYFFLVFQAQHKEKPLPAVTTTLPVAPESLPEPETESEPDSGPPVVGDQGLETFTAEPITEEPALPLAESDPAVLLSLSDLIGEAPVMQFVVADDIISHLVATVDSLTARQVPSLLLPVHSPGGEFEVTADDRPAVVITTLEGDPVKQYVLDPVNYQRYTNYVETIEATDTAGLMAMYRQFHPQFQQAWAELGYLDSSFDERLLEVIDHLLATPDPGPTIRLIKPEGVYLYADPELEGLSAGQKTLIRMGPENSRRIKARLIEIRENLHE